MKEIQGKIKFGVMGIYLPNDIRKESDICFSKITEEQAAEFVEVEYKSDAINVAKRNLEILLKVNDVWIKEWKEKPNPKDFDIYGLFDAADRFGEEERKYNKLPDDLLLIKL